MRIITLCACLLWPIFSFAGYDANVANSPKKLFDQGYYQEALDLVINHLDARVSSGVSVGNDIQIAANAYNELNLYKDIDAFAEKYAERYQGNRYALLALAKLYIDAPHYGKPTKNGHERTKRWGSVQLLAHDRNKALELISKAQVLAQQSLVNDDALYSSYSLMNEALWLDRDAMLSGVLTPINKTNSDSSASEDIHRSQIPNSAAKEFPVAPKVWGLAKSDFERWRFTLAQAAALGGDPKAWSQLVWGLFLASLHDLGGISNQAYLSRDQKVDLSNNQVINPYGEIEVVSQENNFIHILGGVAANPTASPAIKELALMALVDISGNRGHRADTVKYIKHLMPLLNGEQEKRYSKLLEQHERPLAKFRVDNEKSNANIFLDYRNALKVNFTAYTVDTKKLLEIIRDHASVDSRGFQHYELAQLVRSSGKTVLQSPKVWEQVLPSTQHYDDGSAAIVFPEQLGVDHAQPIWLVATLENGYEAELLIWKSATILSSVEADSDVLYYLADAKSGQPTKNVIEFYSGGNDPLDSFKCKTARNGICLIKTEKLKDKRWLIYVANEDGSLSLLNSKSYYFDDSYEEIFDDLKLAIHSSQPVYRPGQAVQIKGWLRSAQSEALGKEMPKLIALNIFAPSGEVLLEKDVQIGDHNQFLVELVLPADAELGTYEIEVEEYLYETFKVEEYKKPEFKVAVDAKKSSSYLSEKLKIAVSGEYYFGESVRSGKVDYSIDVTASAEPQYPKMPWDWYLRPGYAWNSKTDLSHSFPDESGDYDGDTFFESYSGTVSFDAEKGIAFIELDIPSGQFKKWPSTVELAIELEVTDNSRRQVSETQTLILSKNTHQLSTWLDKQFYRTTDRVNFRAQAIISSGQGIASEGRLELRRYEQSRALVNSWVLNTDEHGYAEFNFKLSHPGLYVLAYVQQDQFGNEVRAERLVRVVGNQNPFFSRDSKTLTLESEFSTYLAGSNAKLYVQAKDSDAQVLVVGLTGNKRVVETLSSAGDGVIIKVPTQHPMQNIANFIGLYISEGRIHTASLAIPVVPEDRFLDVEVKPSALKFSPGVK